jgi:hypothetical protein
MIAKIPQTVEIGGRTITVRICLDLEPWGEYRADAREIVLAYRATLSCETLIETLRHEMVHAALDLGGLSYTKDFPEEPIVRCLDGLFHESWERVRESITE